MIDKKISLLESENESFPTGELKIYNNNGSERWYITDKKSKVYLSQKEVSTAKQYAKKKYNEIQLKLLTNAKHIYELFLDYDKDTTTELENFINNPKLMKLLYGTPNLDKSLLQWQNEPYTSNPNYPENLCFKCPSGNLVRSKSEVFIDMVLNQHSIPYRYEAELILGDDKYYPDFTFIHPITSKKYYWEHLGIINNYDYAHKAFYKLRQYYKYGIIPGDNLILTFESKDNPFSASDAEAALAQIKL